MTKNKTMLYAAIMAFTFISPFLFPTYGTQLATLWLMIIVSLTWDMTGGQMGYNSLGNIFFYGTGMYVAALVTIGLTYDVGEYTSAAGGGIYEFTDLQYFGGMALRRDRRGVILLADRCHHRFVDLRLARALFRHRYPRRSHRCG